MNWKLSFHVGIRRTALLFALLVTGIMLAPGLLAPVRAGTFGTVVPIGGQAADIALDEARGVLYIANFTANRIDVMSLSDYSIGTSLNVAAQPGSLALSPDGQFLVVAHFGNFVAPGSPANAVSVINLNNRVRQTFVLGFPPLGVAFGNDGKALVVTTNDFLLFDPVTGATQVLDTIANVTARTLPVPPANFPPQIIAASLGVSGDGFHVYGVSDTIRFHYDVLNKRVTSLGYQASPPLGPRVVSVSRDGKYYTAGWGMFAQSGILLAEFRNPSGDLNIGSHAIDSSGGRIYAQIPEGSAQSTAVPPTTPATPTAPQVNPVAPPILRIVAADNLAVRERLQLPENLAGKALLNASKDVLYSVSDSGVLVLPVGSLNQAHRVTASKQDLVVRGSYCDRGTVTQDIVIQDPGGGSTDFRLSPSVPGITIWPASGATPAIVHVTIDPSTFQNQQGTVVGQIDILSSSAVNIPDPIRVLINNRNPDQRGSFVPIPGTLVDVLADPARDRFYILRQDQNQVLVFDSTGSNQIAVLPTSNTPTQMAITFDQRYLLVGHDDSQLVYVYDLETLAPLEPIVFPSGHYPRSIAASGRAILAACRVAGAAHTIDSINFPSRTATTLPTLGIFQNSVNINTMLVSSPNGASIFAAMPDGTVMLYDANADTFTAARKDFSQLSGAVAASSYAQYLVDNKVLNSSLVVAKQLESGTGASSGFAFVDQTGLRTTRAAVADPGVIQRVDVNLGQSIRPTRIVEAPLPASADNAFTRTLAPLSNRNAIVSLTTSGFTLLPWDYDAAVAPPRLNAVVNAADFTLPIAPGGLISVFGSQLSPVNLATNEVPLPTALGESCLTVNGVPIPMLFVSSTQLNGQLPFNVDGDATMVLRTPGGISDNLNITIQPTAPSIFRSGSAGPETGIPTVVRATNNQLVTLSNPIHPEDEIVIYATGLGQVSPSVREGMPGPTDPLALTLAGVAVNLGDIPLRVDYAGLAPGLVGVYQINAGVPPHVKSGLGVPLTITQGGYSTSLSVRVVR